MIDCGGGGLAVGFCHGEQLPGACDIVGAGAAREQTIVADAVKALWQHMDEEAADEFEGGECHPLLTVAALDAVILPSEGDAVPVEGDQAVKRRSNLALTQL